VDLFRGLAILQMVAYHFCYDLNHFGWIHAAMTREPGWIAWSTLIVTQFLFVAGVTMVLAHDGQARPALSRRWWQIAGCAALVSAASALLFGPRWIWFGVLHFVAVSQLLLRPMLRLGGYNLLAGFVVLALGLGVSLTAFAPDALSWIGFSPVKPRTEDFVPLLPWLGVVLLGMGAGSLWHASRAPAAQALRRIEGSTWALPQLLGRWPLTIYMLHQPLLFAVFDSLRRLGLGPG